MKKIFKYAAPIALAAGLAYAPSALANSVGIGIYNGTGAGAGNSHVDAGTDSIVITGGTTVVNNWNITEASGSYNFPPLQQDVNTLSASVTGPATLTVIFSVQGVTAAGGLITSLADATIPLGWTVQENVYVDTANNIDDTLASLSGLTQIGGPLTENSVNGLQQGAGATPGGTYSLTEELIIHATAKGSINIGGEVTLPDGGTTMILLGGTFCALGAIRRKISK